MGRYQCVCKFKKNKVAVIYGKDDADRSFLKSVMFVDLKTGVIIKEEFPLREVTTLKFITI